MASLAAPLQHSHRARHRRHELSPDELLLAARDAGADINAWTVDEPVRIRQLGLAAVHAVISNVPDVARTALSAST